MVQYVGHVTSEGELIVQLEGNTMSLREFLETTRIGERSQQGRSQGERRQSEQDGTFIAAK